MSLLYMDVMNFARWIFLQRDEWNLDKANGRVRMLVEAAQNSGYELRGFIDASIQSEETRLKWRSRREKQVRTMTRDVPQGLACLVGEMFQAFGIDIHYSVERDNDDTLAFFAHADGADVLSADSDFFRYQDAKYRIFKDFIIKRRHLTLVLHTGGLKPDVPIRALEPKPATEGTMPRLIEVFHKRLFVGGAPSPLVRVLGNPHCVVRPLRQALYARLGIQGAVREEFPVWNGSKTVWDICKAVMPDNAMDDLLDDAKRAVAFFFPQVHLPVEGVEERQWRRHVFGVHAVVAELCCAANGQSFFETMRTLMLPFSGRKGKGKGKKGGHGGVHGKHSVAQWPKGKSKGTDKSIIA